MSDGIKSSGFSWSDETKEDTATAWPDINVSLVSLVSLALHLPPGQKAQAQAGDKIDLRAAIISEWGESCLSSGDTDGDASAGQAVQWINCKVREEVSKCSVELEYFTIYTLNSQDR